MAQLKHLWLLLLLFPLFPNVNHAQNFTWTEDIAPLIYENCSSCHHEGGIAPFALMSFDDVYNYAALIHHAIEFREMPPWPADPNYRHFADETYLEQSQIDMIHDWIDNNFTYGDEALEPDPPVFSVNGSLLDQIDYTVAIEPYTLQSNTDEYRWFVVENPFDETIYISKLEVIPGLDQVVHHADLFLDNTGNSLAFDQADPLPGFNVSAGSPTNTFYVNAWQPGGNVAEYPKDWGIAVAPNDEFVIEIHYGPGGIGLTDDTKMNLQFVTSTNNPRPVRVAWLLNQSPNILLDGPLVIPANEVVSFHQRSAPLAQDMSLISICPHMHYLGKSYKVWYENPQGDSIPLIDIPHWDFHWQKYYTYPLIEKIPAGSVIKSEGFYDNTSANHDNPNDPPITVTAGSTTLDEMFLCYFIYANYQAGDELIVMDSSILEPPVAVSTIEDPTIHLFPNPTKEKLFLKGVHSLPQETTFRIIDLQGRLVKAFSFDALPENWNVEFDIKELSQGIYFIEWRETRKLHSVKFIKQN